MNKRFLISCCLLATTYHLMAQNLVPNPGFELYNNCPTATGGISYSNNYSVFNTVQGWANPMLLGTPDYYNTCASQSSKVSIPVNSFGYQQPRTGNGYAGFIFYNGNPSGFTSSYEYIYCRLNQPLVAGNKYKVGFYVSLAARDSFPQSFIALDKIGAHFSDTIMYKASAPYRFDGVPYHIESQLLPNTFLDDTSGWMKVSGIYTAQGGEQYMVIGRFHYGTQPPYKPVVPPVLDSSKNLISYYYLDDVFVEPFYCDTTYFSHDSLMCDYDSFDMWSVTGADKYLWNTGDTNQKIVITEPGTYWCMAVTDSCDVRIDTFHVTRFIGKVENKYSLYGCNYSGAFNLPLTASGSSTYYLWNTGDTGSAITVQDTGIYYCEFIKDCRLYIDTFYVGSFQAYPVDSRDTTVCRLKEPFTVQLTALQGASAYLWSTGETTRSITVNDTGSYNYTAIKDCELHTNTVHVRHINFEAQLELGNDTTICDDNESLIIGGSINGVHDYVWNTGDTVCCLRPAETRSYALTISDGCNELTDEIYVELVDCENCIAMPNAFTPNNDNLNDKFKAIVLCPIAKYEFIIVNRWGQLLFRTSDWTKGWDGTGNGQPADLGVYHYLLTYTVVGDSKQRILKGDVTLLR